MYMLDAPWNPTVSMLSQLYEYKLTHLNDGPVFPLSALMSSYLMQIDLSAQPGGLISCPHTQPGPGPDFDFI